jgi:SHS2 domain-containing protein
MLKRKGRAVEITVEEKNKEELLEKSAIELMSYLVDLKKIHSTSDFEIELKSINFQILALDWLQEIIDMLNVNAIVLNEFKLKLTREDNYYKLKAKVSGEPIKEIHKLKHNSVMILPRIEYDGKSLKFLLE